MPKYPAKIDLRLTPDLKAALSAEAKAQKLSRGEFVRKTLENLLKTENTPAA